jgi:hypothetical protein
MGQVLRAWRVSCVLGAFLLLTSASAMASFRLTDSPVAGKQGGLHAFGRTPDDRSYDQVIAAIAHSSSDPTPCRWRESDPTRRTVFRETVSGSWDLQGTYLVPRAGRWDFCEYYTTPGAEPRTADNDLTYGYVVRGTTTTRASASGHGGHRLLRGRVSVVGMEAAGSPHDRASSVLIEVKRHGHYHKLAKTPLDDAGRFAQSVKARHGDRLRIRYLGFPHFHIGPSSKPLTIR